jgi:hypothetical protein
VTGPPIAPPPPGISKDWQPGPQATHQAPANLIVMDAQVFPDAVTPILIKFPVQTATSALIANESPYGVQITAGSSVKWIPAWTADLIPLDGLGRQQITATPKLIAGASLATAQLLVTLAMGGEQIPGTYPHAMTRTNVLASTDPANLPIAGIVAPAWYPVSLGVTYGALQIPNAFIFSVQIAAASYSQLVAFTPPLAGRSITLKGYDFVIREAVAGSSVMALVYGSAPNVHDDKWYFEITAGGEAHYQGDFSMGLAFGGNVNSRAGFGMYNYAAVPITFVGQVWIR